MKARLAYVAMAAASLFLLPAHAADNCSGHYINVGQSADVTDLGNGNSLIVFKNVSVNVTDDRTSPIYMTSGDCVGTALILNGATSASGRCSRKDKDGDIYSYEFSLPAGADKGSWTFVGGTGKFAKLRWSGWWKETMVSGKSAGGVWGGNCS